MATGEVRRRMLERDEILRLDRERIYCGGGLG